jgi:hypothetical protein
MVRTAAPVRSIVANVARRFQSAHAAQAGWQQMVKQAQEQSIKGTASVVATSRSVGAADVQPKAEPAGEAKPKCAVSSASAWQQMVEMANKLGSVDEARVDHPKVTMKVMAGDPCKATAKNTASSLVDACRRRLVTHDCHSLHFRFCAGSGARRHVKRAHFLLLVPHGPHALLPRHLTS